MNSLKVLLLMFLLLVSSFASSFDEVEYDNSNCKVLESHGFRTYKNTDSSTANRMDCFLLLRMFIAMGLPLKHDRLGEEFSVLHQSNEGKETICKVVNNTTHTKWEIDSTSLKSYLHSRNISEGSPKEKINAMFLNFIKETFSERLDEEFPLICNFVGA